MKKFDLNIEKVLENWEVHHALREIISNAMDETVLSHSKKDIAIFQDPHHKWHIRDYGRGLKYEHLTQKENEEKVESPHLIGKFGVGLKDALATFDRRGVDVLIKSKYGDITLGRASKSDFSDIITLHAYVSPPSEPNFVGTEFILAGCTADDINTAKNMFLKFSGDKLLERTPVGDILAKAADTSMIYINGVRVAEEENFLFSYNITSLTSSIKKALNRERTNVGRSAYTDRVKTILLACRGGDVAQALMEELSNFQAGILKDELKWLDVYVHACKLMNAQKKVIFLTPNERAYQAGVLQYARREGYRIIIVPENIRKKLSGETDYNGNPLRDIDEYIRQWNESFEFEFTDLRKLTAAERRVYNQTDAIFNSIGGRPSDVLDLRISETMRMGIPGADADGVWESDLGRIVIKRSCLQNLSDYAGVLLHECAHALSNAPDVSERFEQALTELLGLVAENYLSKLPKPKAASSRH